MMDQEALKAQYEATIFSMAHGVDADTMILMMEMFADLEEYGAAEGVRLAIADYQWSSRKQNCRVRPVMLHEAMGFPDMDEEDFDEGYMDEGYEDLD